MTATPGGEWTAAERAAMKERADELRAEKGGKKKAEALEDLMSKIEAMPETERLLAQHVHTLVTEAGPELEPRTWYGMPAYTKDGKVLCFFQGASKFDSRYCTFGFQDVASLDDGVMWPTAFALTSIGPAEQETITELVKRACR